MLISVKLIRKRVNMFFETFDHGPIGECPKKETAFICKDGFLCSIFYLTPARTALATRAICARGRSSIARHA